MTPVHTLWLLVVLVQGYEMPRNTFLSLQSCEMVSKLIPGAYCMEVPLAGD